MPKCSLALPSHPRNMIFIRTTCFLLIFPIQRPGIQQCQAPYVGRTGCLELLDQKQIRDLSSVSSASSLPLASNSGRGCGHGTWEGVFVACSVGGYNVGAEVANRAPLKQMVGSEVGK